MKRLILVMLLGVMLTGCANGLVADAAYFRCPGYEEYKEANGAYSRAQMKQQDILFAYGRVPLNAVTTEENGVTTTVLVNPLEDERKAIAKEMAIHLKKVKEFEKTCTLYSW
ncbi:hypothetical protein D3C84_838440 [compost metagenome]